MKIYKYVFVISVALFGLLLLMELTPRDSDSPSGEHSGPNQPAGSLSIVDSPDASTPADSAASTKQAGPSEEGSPTLPHRETQKLRALTALPAAIQLRKPYEQYLSNIDAALSGDADAQYEVYRALQICSEVPRHAEVERMRANRDIEPDLMGVVELRHSECIRLHDILPGEEMRSGRDQWLESAVEQGQALAVLTRQAAVGLDPTLDKRELFERAFESGNADVFSLMTLYHAASESSDETEMNAWNFFRCHEDPVCDTEEFIDVLVDGGFEHQFVPVVDRIVEIRSALDSGDWETLIPEH